MSDQAACAHLSVSYLAQAVDSHDPSQGLRGWWECDSGCGTNFVSEYERGALLAVVRATIPYRNAHTMAGANQEGESILDFQERLVGLRAELDKALAALPEHLR